jgi:DNA-binding response OmpR family regulator
MNILLVEPDNILKQTVINALENDGHTVIGAENAQQAMDELDKSKNFDLVILELQLAGHGGVEFLYECRSYSEWQELPVIVHSMVPANRLARNQKMLDLLGVKSYFYKPATSLGQLRGRVNELAAAVIG